MPRSVEIMEAAAAALSELNAEVTALRERQLSVVASAAATGTGTMDAAFGLGARFRLVYVRCHFAGTSGHGPLRIVLDSQSGSAYDTCLYTVLKAGVGYDVNFRIPAEEALEPSSWVFQSGDQIRVQWTNPGGITWGVEVGLALAS